jgi:hypothetical protein
VTSCRSVFAPALFVTLVTVGSAARMSSAPLRPSAGSGKVAPPSPVHGEVRHVKFSADGKYALAQDEASVYVLSREPFELLFKFDAQDAEPAWFTSDSKQVGITSGKLQVELWDIASQKRTSLIDGSAIDSGCLQTKVSPDAKYAACLTPEFDFRLYELSTARVLMTRKDFYQVTADVDRLEVFLGTAFVPRRFNLVRMEYSPDGADLLVTRSTNPTAFELSGHAGIAPFPTANAMVAALSAAVVNGSSAARTGGTSMPARTGMAITALTDPVAKQELRNPRVQDILTKELEGPSTNTPGLNFEKEESAQALHAMDEIAVNLEKRQVAPLHAALADFFWGPAVFVAPGMLVAQNSHEPSKSVVAKFPDGALVHKLDLTGVWFAPSASGDFVIVRPARQAASGVFDWKTQKWVLTMKTATTVDIQGGEFIIPIGTDAVAMFDAGTTKFKSKVVLR